MVQVIRLAHVGLHAKSLSNQAEFYNDRWGLDRVDEHGGELFFRADGPDHHVLTLHAGEADAAGERSGRRLRTIVLSGTAKRLWRVHPGGAKAWLDRGE